MLGKLGRPLESLPEDLAAAIDRPLTPSWAHYCGILRQTAINSLYHSRSLGLEITHVVLVKSFLAGGWIMPGECLQSSKHISSPVIATKIT